MTAHLGFRRWRLKPIDAGRLEVREAPNIGLKVYMSLSRIQEYVVNCCGLSFFAEL